MGFYEVAKVGSPFDPSNRFESSYILGSSALAGYRLLLALYCFVTNIFKLAWTGPGAENPGHSFSYFTNITYWALSFYFLFAGYHTFYYARYGQAPLQSWPRILQFLHSLFYSTIVVFPFVVTAAYWLILASPTWDDLPFDTWSNVSVHILNSVFAFLEIALTRVGPMPWIHIPFIALFLAGYIGVAYITKATEGFYTYNVLDPHGKGGTKSVVKYIIGIIVGACVIFVIVAGVNWVKVMFCEKVLGIDEIQYVHRGRRKKQHGPRSFEHKG